MAETNVEKAQNEKVDFSKITETLESVAPGGEEKS